MKRWAAWGREERKRELVCLVLKPPLPAASKQKHTKAVACLLQKHKYIYHTCMVYFLLYFYPLSTPM